MRIMRALFYIDDDNLDATLLYSEFTNAQLAKSSRSAAREYDDYSLCVGGNSNMGTWNVYVQRVLQRWNNARQRATDVERKKDHIYIDAHI